MGSLNSEQKKAIKSTILECRDILEKDIEQVLINYGIYINKDWVNLRDLKNLTEEQENNRKNIEKAIEKLEKGGFKRDKAVIEYIKEVSYTYLNRLAALRVMEVRGLIDEILVPRVEYGNKSFINSRFYEVAREFCKYETDGGLGYLLNIMFNEISEEIKILFNTEDEYSFITPSSASLLKVIELLCTNIDEDSWRQDEIIGWIYQYFNDKEKDDVFDRLYNKKQKIYVEDIPAATQLFTPDWIVDWIVDNSLGSLWDEIKQGKRENKKVEDIKLLDPCCGSGHFLVKAFDLFYEMYVEEGLYTKEEIPYKILENNLYGIDIDLRAVQLTSLILFIKVKSSLKENGFNTNTKGKLSVNLVCADAILLNGKRLEELKEKHKDNKPILKMIEIIYEEFEDVRLKGSLIQPEKKLFPLFEEYKNRIALRELSKVKKTKKNQTKGQQNLLEETNEITFSEYKSQRNFSKEERELMISLDAIYSEAIRANDISRQLFASEAKKSVKLVDIFMKQYDVVVTNQPYMGKRSMNDKLKKFADENYKISSYDLYSLFIDRCLEFIPKSGLLGMITQQSFMFISTYDKFRDKLLLNYRLRKVVQLGSRAFDDISGEKVNTVMFILERNSKEKDGEYCRLVNYGSSDLKKENLAKQENWYNCNQNEFAKIEGKPFVFWISDNMRELFDKNKSLGDVVYIKQGLATGDNGRFVRFFWEVDSGKIGVKWERYCKGAGYRQYYGGINSIVLWEENGREIKSFIDPQTKKLKSRPQNEEYYFKEGITYSLIGSGGFSARYLPEGCIFDVGGSCIFPKSEDISIYYLLGLLNTEFVNYILGLLNPTLNYQVGDLKRVPYVKPSKEIKEKVECYAKKCVAISYKIESFDENSVDFKMPELLLNKDSTIIDSFINYISNMYLMKVEYCYYKYKIEILIRELYKLNDEDINAIRKELGDLPLEIKITQDIKVFNYPFDNEILDFINNIKNTDKAVFTDENSKKELLNDFIDGEDLYVLSKKYKINPLDIANDLLDKNIYTNKHMKKYVEKLLSFYIGMILGRYNLFTIDFKEDGILPIDSSIYSQSLLEKIYEAIEVTFGKENADIVIDEIEEILGKNIEEYMIKDFYETHIKIFEKRPIYWHICSPKKTFNCFVYYHKLDDDTLYKVKSIYLKQMIDRYEEDLKYYTNQLIEARTKGDKSKEKDFKNRCSDLEAKLEDLYILDKKIMEILPYKPDIDKGVLYNIIPLEPILASPISTKKEREDYYKEVGKQ